MGLHVFLSLLVALAISLLIFVPFTGVLVRFRANYSPKGLQLDAEGGAIPHAGPVVRSFFAMTGRVYRIEVYPAAFIMCDPFLSFFQGWSGFYKGLSSFQIFPSL